MKTKTITAERLKELGLEQAGNTLNERKEFDRKCSIAYEHYRYVTQGHMDKFNEKLRKKTEKGEAYTLTYDMLKCTNLKQYPEVPPESVLEDLKTAKDRGCFDEFEVAKIESVEERPDPILFGRVTGNSHRFFISQWDLDVKISDLINEDEG